jgi:hypothetical protein
MASVCFSIPEAAAAPLAIVEPDAKYPFLYRIRYPDGHLSDMVNLTRAKDAACLRSLNSPPQETLAQGSQARKKAELGENIGQSVNRAQRPRRGLLARGR